MDYLPQKAPEIDVQMDKRKKKLQQFREYLVDTNLVRSMVTFLLKLKREDPPPENIADYIEQFFGSYRDPKWVQMEQWETECQRFRQEEGKLVEEIEGLRDQIDRVKRTAILEEDFKQLDPQETGTFSTKAWVLKISGDKKFSDDAKLTKEQFISFILEHLLVTEEEANEEPAQDEEEATPEGEAPPEESKGEPEPVEKEARDIWSEVYQPVREAIYPDEEGKPIPPPYAGRLDEPNYLYFVEKLRTFKP